jgi:hypothetical protein
MSPHEVCVSVARMWRRECAADLCKECAFQFSNPVLLPASRMSNLSSRCLEVESTAERCRCLLSSAGGISTLIGLPRGSGSMDVEPCIPSLALRQGWALCSPHQSEARCKSHFAVTDRRPALQLLGTKVPIHLHESWVWKHTGCASWNLH